MNTSVGACLFFSFFRIRFFSSASSWSPTLWMNELIGLIYQWTANVIICCTKYVTYNERCVFTTCCIQITKHVRSKSSINLPNMRVLSCGVHRPCAETYVLYHFNIFHANRCENWILVAVNVANAVLSNEDTERKEKKMKEYIITCCE